MSTDSKTITPKLFADEAARRAATAKIMDKIHQVLFFFHEEHEPEIENDDVKEDLGIFVWGVAAAAMVAAGMRVVGVDEQSGRYIATFEPVESVRKMLIEQDIGEEEDIYFEEYFNDVDPDCVFSWHDETLMSD